MNYHGHRYTNIPEWSHYYNYSEYRVDSSWNYARYEVINYYSGNYQSLKIEKKEDCI